MAIEIDGLGDEVTESQFNIEIIKRVEQLLEIHHVPSYEVAATCEDLIFDSIQFLLKIENAVYLMYLRQFPVPGAVNKTVMDCITEASTEVRDESFNQLLDLVSLRKRLVDFVDSWMLYIAPNLSALVGTVVAGKLMVTAGGLGFLANMPPCNIQLLGFQKINLDGLPAQFTLGYLQESKILQTFPLAVTTGATLVLAAKSSTAARFDFLEKDPSGNTGKHLQQVVLNKFTSLSYGKSLLPEVEVLYQSTAPGISRQIREGGKGLERTSVEFPSRSGGKLL